MQVAAKPKARGAKGTADAKSSGMSDGIMTHLDADEKILGNIPADVGAVAQNRIPERLTNANPAKSRQRQKSHLATSSTNNKSKKL